MNQQLTVELIPDSGEGGFTARVPDIPADGEGETEEEALQAYIEAFGLEDTISRINNPARLLSVFRNALPTGRR